MAESPVNHHNPQSSSGDSVDLDVEIVAGNDIASNSSGFTGSSSSKHSMSIESSATSKSDSGSSQPRKFEKHGESYKLRILATKLFDDRVPFRKKLKLFHRFANLKDDGTIQLEVPEDIKPQSLDIIPGAVHTECIDEEPFDTAELRDIPPLQIVILIVGTRGDVQPFIAIGKRLQEDGHRVRLATHSNFKDFVLTAGLEFFPLGGDPKVLAGYMVKNKGFLPSVPSEIPTQRQQIRDIVFSLLPACKDPDPDTNVPFKVDAIIANPPAYGWISSPFTFSVCRIFSIFRCFNWMYLL